MPADWSIQIRIWLDKAFWPIAFKQIKLWKTDTSHLYLLVKNLRILQQRIFYKGNLMYGVRNGMRFIPRLEKQRNRLEEENF